MTESKTHISGDVWHSISVTVAPEAAEAVEYAFNSLDALGTEINHLQKRNSESVTVLGYFNDLPDDEHFQDELHYALRIYGFTEETASQVERKQIENTDWLAEWKKHWKPTTIDEFVIAPPWSDVDEVEKMVIRIEPNMAFGTGTHETTQLCLRAIGRYYEPGDTFLDVGTGTGILAIAAAKVNLKFEISNLKPGDQTSILNLKSEISDLKGGAETSNLESQISNFKLLACDTDVDSVSIARDNADLNHVGDAIDFSVGTISKESSPADFVCANLTLDVILPVLPLLVEKARKTLVLSGILVEQKVEIVNALADLGISSPEIKEAGEWISVVVTSGEPSDE
jgi:ribosomal protein L11 methyltransferase